MVGRRLARRQEEIVLDPVTDAAGLLALQEVGRGGGGRRERRAATACTWRRRPATHPQVLTGASPRGSLGLVLTARAWALLHGRDYVVPEDVKAVARAGPRPPDHGEAGAVDGGRLGRVDRGRRAGPGAHPRHPRARRAESDERLGADRGAAAGASAVTAAALGLALLLGQPVMVVLVAPLLPLRGAGRGQPPDLPPRIRSVVDHADAARGPGHGVPAAASTTPTGTEHVVRATGPAPYVALHPPGGLQGALLRDGAARPGSRSARGAGGGATLAHEKVALTSAWGGFRWGPVLVHGHALTVLPGTAPFDSRAEVPQPLGLVGAHRSQRIGDGTRVLRDPAVPRGRPAAADQLAGVAALRSRCTWWPPAARRTAPSSSSSTRWPSTASPAGSTARPARLDVTVRAAAALAEHYVRRGDRVALRVLGGGGESLSCGGGATPPAAVQGTLARVRPGEPRDLDADAAPLPGRRRDRRHRALADAARGGRHRHRRAGGERAPGDRGGHPARGRVPRPCRGTPTP